MDQELLDLCCLELDDQLEPVYNIDIAIDNQDETTAPVKRVESEQVKKRRKAKNRRSAAAHKIRTKRHRIELQKANCGLGCRIITAAI